MAIYISESVIVHQSEINRSNYLLVKLLNMHTQQTHIRAVHRWPE